MEAKFVENDEFEIFGSEDKLYPYISVSITKEQMDKLPENFETYWCEIDGKKLFQVRNRDGTVAGHIAFLVIK